MDPLGGIPGNGETNPASHGIPEVVRSGKVEIIQDCGDVLDISLPVIGVGLVGLVACPMTTCVDQDEPILRLQRFHVSQVVPSFQTVSDPMLDHQGLAITLNPIMNSDTLVDRIWHRIASLNTVPPDATMASGDAGIVDQT